MVLAYSTKQTHKYILADTGCGMKFSYIKSISHDEYPHTGTIEIFGKFDILCKSEIVIFFERHTVEMKKKNQRLL